MKRIEVLIRTTKLEDVRLSLEKLGICGLTCEQVRGYGRQQGQTDKYRGSTYALNLVPKLKLEIVLPDQLVEPCIEALIDTCRTGEIGDGKIFVSEVLEAVRIRTGETGDAAVL